MNLTYIKCLPVQSKSGINYAFEIKKDANGITYTLYDRAPSLLNIFKPKKLWEIENALEAKEGVTDYDIGVYVSGEYEFWNKV